MANVNFNIPFIPQEGITQQILQALHEGLQQKQFRETHALAQESETRRAEDEKRRQQQTDAQINLEQARHEMLQAQMKRDQELDPIRKRQLEADAAFKESQVKDAEQKAKFFQSDQLAVPAGKSPFDVFSEGIKKQIESGGPMSGEEAAQWDAAHKVASQKRDVTELYTAANAIRQGRLKTEPETDYRAWHSAFVKEHGREPSTAEVLAFRTAGAAVFAGPRQQAVDLQKAKAAEVLFNPALDASWRLSRMEDDYKEALKGNQQSMVSMLANHIGMTLGLQRGARITLAQWQEAEQSLPMLQRIKAKWSKDGYLEGVVLSPQQMEQMLHLGRSQRLLVWDKARAQLEQMRQLVPDLPEPKDTYQEKKVTPFAEWQQQQKQ